MKRIIDASRDVRTDGNYFYKSSSDPSYKLDLEYSIYQKLGIAVEKILKIPHLGERIDGFLGYEDQLMDALTEFSSLDIDAPHLDPVHDVTNLTTYHFRHHPDKSAPVLRAIEENADLLESAKGDVLCHGDVSRRNVLISPAGEIRLIDYESVVRAHQHHDTSAIHYFNARYHYRNQLEKETGIYSNRDNWDHMKRIDVGHVDLAPLVRPNVPINQGNLVFYFLRSTGYRMGLSGGGPDLIDRLIAQDYGINSSLLDLPGGTEVVFEMDGAVQSVS